MSVGMPAYLKLQAFGAIVEQAFEGSCYQVGSSVKGKNWRDVDVRLIMDDADYTKLLGIGPKENQHHSTAWTSFCMAYSALGQEMTGLPIDFQIQSMTDANERFRGSKEHPRNSLGMTSELLRHLNDKGAQRAMYQGLLGNFTMKEIDNVEELEVGKWYHLFDKESEQYLGCYMLQCEHPEAGEEGDRPAFFTNNRWWAHPSNDQITGRCFIFGPVTKPLLTLSGMRELVEKMDEVV